MFTTIAQNDALMISQCIEEVETNAFSNIIKETLINSTMVETSNKNKNQHLI
jgi:hypothetical protein